MTRSPISSAAVLGAGTMGAQIAAHLANAGIPTLLLDLTAAVARQGFDRARALKPDPFFTPDAAGLVTLGGFDADLGRVASADWIVEAIVERLDLKRALLERIDAVRTPGTIVSSNTSGIPISALAEGRGDDFRRHWLGTHFFNPPRYLHLLEVIPTAETDPDVVDRLSRFADVTLGKGVVVAKDTPNFIANHIGLFGVVQILRVLERGEYTIEEIDAITGPAMGRPKSATFRTMDIAGIDVLGHVVSNLAGRLPPDRSAVFALPEFVRRLIERGSIGEKAGEGFYKRQKGAAGTEILTLDPGALEYRPRRSPALASLDAARGIEDPGARIRTLFLGRDRVGAFLRETLGPTLLYTARVALDIAHSIDDVDRAMQWGFGWDLGPFETFDAIGVREVVEACAGAGGAAPADLPPLVADVLAKGRNCFRDGRVPPAGPGLQILRAAKERQRVVRTNPGASLVDLGDGVLAVEFHSKMNAIGGDTIEMLHAGIAEASRNFSALVIGNDAPAFSAGANLMLLLLEAQEENWDEIDLMVRAFQGATLALRHADVPVVVCPAGLTLGGGCEIALHGDRVAAAAESYIGLVEVGVGLIPAGGGTKEMLARAVEGLPAGADLLPFVQRVFETIGFGKVSTSAAHARQLGYLRAADAIVMNRGRQIATAKALALERVREGYRAPARRTIAVGGATLRAALDLGVHLAWRAGRLSDHDALIGRTLANVLAGGALPQQTSVSEQYLLDLERDAFLKLCGERKTLERIQYTLKTGKSLRN
ncbi:MAG: 3-hydroxyacyl-CoA dehydrogenase NAD-binding domain-containing protein [Betaproteobacteria bacterium]